MKKLVTAFNLVIFISCISKGSGQESAHQAAIKKSESRKAIIADTSQSDIQLACGNDDADYVLLTHEHPKTTNRKPPRPPKKPKPSDFKPGVPSNFNPHIIDSYGSQPLQLNPNHLAAAILAKSASNVSSVGSTSSESNVQPQAETPKSPLSGQSSESAQSANSPLSSPVSHATVPAKFLSSDKTALNCSEKPAHHNEVILEIQQPDLPSGIKQDATAANQSLATQSNAQATSCQNQSQQTYVKPETSKPESADSKTPKQPDGDKQKKSRFKFNCFKSSKCCNFKCIPAKSNFKCSFSNCCLPWSCSKKKNKNG